MGKARIAGFFKSHSITIFFLFQKMTEVAGLLLPPDHRLTSVRRYEAGPPEGLELVKNFNKIIFK